jgi:hypothetical protein
MCKEIKAYLWFYYLLGQSNKVEKRRFLWVGLDLKEDATPAKSSKIKLIKWDKVYKVG